MSQVVVRHVVEDARAAQEVADALIVAGFAAELAPVPAPGDETTAPGDAAAAIIAVISGAALLNNDFDAAVAAALRADQRWVPVLVGLSAWEFGMRRPAWARGLGAFTPPELVTGAADRAAAALAARLTELGLVAGPPGSPPARPASSAALLTDRPYPNILDRGPSVLISQPGSITFGELPTQPPAASASPIAPPAGAATSAPTPRVEPSREEPEAPIRWDPIDVGEDDDEEERPPQPRPSPPIAVTAPPPPADRRDESEAVGQVAAAKPTPARRYQPAPPPGPIKATVKAQPRQTAAGATPTPRRRNSACLIVAAVLFGFPILGVVVLGIIGFLVGGPSRRDTLEVATAVPSDVVVTVVPIAAAPDVATAVSALTTRAATSAIRTTTPTRPAIAVATRAATAAPSPVPTPPSTQVTDAFDAADGGLLPRESGDPARYRLAYERGEYVIAIVDPAWDRIPTARVQPVYRDAMLAVDARLVGATPGRAISLACRDQGSDSGSQYRFTINPARGQVKLARFDSGKETALVDWRSAAALRVGTQTNRLELRCLDDSVVALVNGQVVASARDSTYREGQFWLSAGTFSGTQGTTEARFDSLVIAVPIP